MSFAETDYAEKTCWHPTRSTYSRKLLGRKKNNECYEFMLTSGNSDNGDNLYNKTEY